MRDSRDYDHPTKREIAHRILQVLYKIRASDQTVLHISIAGMSMTICGIMLYLQNVPKIWSHLHTRNDDQENAKSDHIIMAWEPYHREYRFSQFAVPIGVTSTELDNRITSEYYLLFGYPRFVPKWMLSYSTEKVYSHCKLIQVSFT